MRNSRRIILPALAALVLSLLALSPAKAERIPGTCQGVLTPGPTQVTCSFTHQGRSLFAFAGAVNTTIGRNQTLLGNIFTPNPVSIIVDIFQVDDPSFAVASCSFNGNTGGVLPPLFVGPCVGPEQPTLPDNEPLICRARGRTHAVFGCLSTPDLDHL